MVAWTDPQHPVVQMLKKLCELGYSAYRITIAINTEFQTALTRNAIIGAKHRLKIFKTPPTPTAEASPTPTPVVKARAKRRPRRRGNSGMITVACALNDLTNQTCRWPIGDPRSAEFRFCGRPEADFVSGRPYCEVHTRKAFKRYAREEG
jgi:GcrA cell cycle regulator